MSSDDYFSAVGPTLIDSAACRRLHPEPFVVVDGGSRGELFAPFNSVKRPIEVVAFEPAPADGDSRRGTTHVNAALWSSTGVEELHVAHRPATSSIYPPDGDVLECFPDRLGMPTRRTVERMEVPTTSIDVEVENGAFPPPDFIKLDIHSAEYEALVGAENALRFASGILVETWHTPIHRGQECHGRIEAFLNDHGFVLFDLRRASAWRHSIDGMEPLSDRARLVGSESLFLPRSKGDRRLTALIAIADLFQYNTHAIQTLDRYRGDVSEDDFEELLATLRRISSRRERVARNAARRRIGRLARVAKQIVRRRRDVRRPPSS